MYTEKKAAAAMEMSARTVKMKVSSGRDKGRGQVVLQGNLTLDCVEEVVRGLREAAQKYTSVELRAERVTGLDLGFLQLLYSLDFAMRERGGELVVRLDLEKDLEMLLRNTGFASWVDPRPKQDKK